MLPSPLHPAIVHFPVVLMVFLPLVALGALWAIRRGATPLRAWAMPAALAALLTLSAWAAVQTGEAQEEQVEDAVGEQALGTHEAAADRFLILSGIVLVVTAAGLARGRLGQAARPIAVVAALGLMAAGFQVGHTGGQLVYSNGTMRGIASATADQGEQPEVRGPTRRDRGNHDGRGDHDD